MPASSIRPARLAARPCRGATQEHAERAHGEPGRHADEQVRDARARVAVLDEGHRLDRHRRERRERAEEADRDQRPHPTRRPAPFVHDREEAAEHERARQVGDERRARERAGRDGDDPAHAVPRQRTGRAADRDAREHARMHARVGDERGVYLIDRFVGHQRSQTRAGAGRGGGRVLRGEHGAPAHLEQVRDPRRDASRSTSRCRRGWASRRGSPCAGISVSPSSARSLIARTVDHATPRCAHTAATEPVSMSTAITPCAMKSASRSGSTMKSSEVTIEPRGGRPVDRRRVVAGAVAHRRTTTSGITMSPMPTLGPTPPAIPTTITRSNGPRSSSRSVALVAERGAHAGGGRDDVGVADRAGVHGDAADLRRPQARRPSRPRRNSDFIGARTPTRTRSVACMGCSLPENEAGAARGNLGSPRAQLRRRSRADSCSRSRPARCSPGPPSGGRPASRRRRRRRARSRLWLLPQRSDPVSVAILAAFARRRIGAARRTTRRRRPTTASGRRARATGAVLLVVVDRLRHVRRGRDARRRTGSAAASRTARTLTAAVALDVRRRAQPHRDAADHAHPRRRAREGHVLRGREGDRRRAADHPRARTSTASCSGTTRITTTNGAGSIRAIPSSNARRPRSGARSASAPRTTARRTATARRSSRTS